MSKDAYSDTPPSFSSTHKERTQTEYPFVYTPVLYSTSFSMYCVTRGHTGMGQLLTFVRVLRWNTMQVK